jgi:glyoxalase family protein
MSNLITGIHHVTALANDPQKNVDFYAGILGLRLVKKTVNFDAPEVYHLYYGDEDGNPGSIMTFFPYSGIQQGRKGKGMLNVTSFSISEQAVDYWLKRLEKFKIPYKEPQQRFEETVIYFEDYDGLGLELVANSKDERKGFTYGNIPLENSIKGFYGVSISEEGYERTAGLLSTQLNHTLISENGNRFRYSASGKVGDFVDILCTPDALRGLGGGGTVHHIAFNTNTDADQLLVREAIAKVNLNVTPVIDRQYFHSIYFREPGGVLFEVATVPPGFSVDEPKEHLGESLKLPHQYEQYRAELEKVLPKLVIDLKTFA